VDLVWLGEPAGSDVAAVGGKAANLSRLAGSYPVPPGFCLPAGAFARLRITNDDTSGAPSRDLLEIVEGAYRALAARCGVTDVAVAVRSSAIDEDGAGASFAGQHESFLNVVGAPDVAVAIGRCWASARSERAITYRRLRAAADPGVGVAVLVQRLVAAEVSAVVFSANPVTSNRDEIVINASWGLGESIVGGTVTPDTYVVRKTDLTPLSRTIGGKRIMTVAIPSGTREVDVPAFLRSRPTFSDRQVVEVARLARDLERWFGWPVDVECAYDGGQLYLLQCRPISTLKHPGSF
jgi:pyruvate,water dikinase